MHFERTISAKDGSVICDACFRARQRRYNASRDPERDKANHEKYLAANPQSRRETQLKYRWRLTPEQFRARLVAQDHRCGLCRTSLDGETFVDHDHTCCPPRSKTCGGCIRAILCRKCNQGLGMFNDDPDLLIAAAMYVVRLRDALPELPAVR